MATPLDRLRQNTNHVVLAYNFRSPSGAAMDITGATLTGKIRRIDTNPPGNSVVVTGALTVVAAKIDGSYTWKPSLTDTANLGEYELEVTATFPDTTIAKDDLQGFDVLATI